MKLRDLCWDAGGPHVDLSVPKMQRNGAELRFSATLGEEPEVELVLL